MATFLVGFDGRWQGKFDDLDETSAWAEEVATTGRPVEVVRKRFGFYRFVTGFPESEREAMSMRRSVPYFEGGGVY